MRITLPIAEIAEIAHMANCQRQQQRRQSGRHDDRQGGVLAQVDDRERDRHAQHVAEHGAQAGLHQNDLVDVSRRRAQRPQRGELDRWSLVLE